MPASLHIRDLTVSFGRKIILDAIELNVSPGHRVGIVGPNGVGKSTLLRALAGDVRIERGSARCTPTSANVGYLPQERERQPGETVAGFLGRRSGVAEASAALDSATAALAAGSAGADDVYSDSLDRWLALGGADFETRTGEVLSEFGLATGLLTQPMTTLSGGQAARVGLVGFVLSRFDVYLLDEPTNDVDLAGLATLERWVTNLSAPVVLVSHDRTFLANTVTHVLELDEFTHRGASYGGGWEAYRREKEVARQLAWERFDDYDTKRKGLAARAQQEREWATQGLSKAKKLPADNDKNIRTFKINQTEKLAARAARTERLADRLEVVDKPREAWQLRLNIPMADRGSSVVARLDGAVVDRGGFRLGPIDVLVGFGERVVVSGVNGSGKTTLIDALLGRLPLTEGSQYLGPGVRIGEVEQARQRLLGDASVLRAFMDETGQLMSDARTLLAKFGLVGDHVDRPAGTLSPGERTRATLALLMALGANCLVLDEPTNHLDLPAIEQLEQALATFPGTVLLVTHDRTLRAGVTLTREIDVVDGRIAGDRAL